MSRPLLFDENGALCGEGFVAAVERPMKGEPA